MFTDRGRDSRTHVGVRLVGTLVRGRRAVIRGVESDAVKRLEA